MLFDIVTVPLPLRVTLPSSTSSVKLPDEFRLRAPLLEMLPKASRTSPFRMFSVSPEPMVSVPNCPAFTFMFTLAEAVPMVTASALVGTPAFQFPGVFQLLSPAVPVHESAVRGGGACRGARRPTVIPASGCCESLRFDPVAACAEAKPLRLKRTASRQREMIHRVTGREDEGRMRLSERKILRARHRFVAQCSRPKDLSMAVGRGVYTIPHSMSSRNSQEF